MARMVLAVAADAAVAVAAVPATAAPVAAAPVAAAPVPNKVDPSVASVTGSHIIISSQIRRRAVSRPHNFRAY